MPGARKPYLNWLSMNLSHQSGYSNLTMLRRTLFTSSALPCAGHSNFPHTPHSQFCILHFLRPIGGEAVNDENLARLQRRQLLQAPPDVEPFILGEDYDGEVCHLSVHNNPFRLVAAAKQPLVGGFHLGTDSLPGEITFNPCLSPFAHFP